MCRTLNFAMSWAVFVSITLPCPAVENGPAAFERTRAVGDIQYNKTDAGGDVSQLMQVMPEVYDAKTGMNRVALLQWLSGDVRADETQAIRDGLVDVVDECSTSVASRPEYIDLVIPWKFNKGDRSLKFELRSFEKFGLLDFVKNVYVLVDSDYVKSVNSSRTNNNTKFHIVTPKDAFGADEWCDWEAPLKRQTEVVKVPSSWCKVHKLHLIPNISSYVLLVPDDVILLDNFSVGLFFDAEQSKPYGWSHGSLGCGQCLGDRPTSPLHAPSLLNTCVMGKVAEVLKQKWYTPRSGQGKQLTAGSMMDLACITVHTLRRAGRLAGFYGYGGSPPSRKPLFHECHTNGGCRSPAQFQKRATFWNVQGDGISAEYRNNDALHAVFFDWFNDTFPNSSRFELGVEDLQAHGGP